MPLRWRFFRHNGLTLPRICCDILLLQLLQDLWNGLPVDTVALGLIYLKDFGTGLNWFLIASKVRSMFSQARMLTEFLPQGTSRYQPTVAQKTFPSKYKTTFKPTWMTRMYGGRSLCPPFRAWAWASGKWSFQSAECLTCSRYILV